MPRLMTWLGPWIAIRDTDSVVRLAHVSLLVLLLVLSLPRGPQKRNYHRSQGDKLAVC